MEKPMTQPRAARGLAYLESHGDESPEEAAIDALANLLHAYHALGVDMESTFETAQNLFWDEVEEDNEDL